MTAAKHQIPIISRGLYVSFSSSKKHFANAKINVAMLLFVKKTVIFVTAYVVNQG
jgi:hypothetical protein